jgi:HK97 family phage prohead protease
MGDLIKLGNLELLDPRKFGLRGYASVTGVLVPGYREVVERGAFDEIIQRVSEIPITYNHDFVGLQLGWTTHLAEDDTGLYFEGRVAPTLDAAEVLTTIAEKGRMDSSFTFQYGETEADDDGILHIQSFSELIELGPVIIGANPEAYVEVMPLAEATDQIADVDQIISALERAAERIKGVASL